MSLSTHYRAAELHNLASHARTVAAVAHGRGDHLIAHELTQQAHEHSINAHKYSQELLTEAKKATVGNAKAGEALESDCG
jgi:hypothetical protein